MPETTTHSKHNVTVGLLTLDLFTGRMQALWAALLIITISMEVVPIPVLPMPVFYSFYLAKAILFLALGFLSPLAFSRFNSMHHAVIVAGLSAAMVEILQGFTQHTHNFYFIELALKLLHLMAGFCCGIVSRFDRSLSLGKLRIQLTEGRR